jgi:hypothetical protein
MLNLIPLISIFFISNQIEFYFTKLTINSTEHQDFFYTIKTKQISKSKPEKKIFKGKTLLESILFFFFFFFCDSVFTTAISFLLIIDGVTIYEFNHDWKFEG